MMIFSGLKARLDTKYYSIGDAVTMECSLGVGSDGIVPATTAWYAITLNSFTVNFCFCWCMV